MACFLVPAAEAVVVTIARHNTEKNEEKTEEIRVQTEEGQVKEVRHIPFSRKLKWLTNMLWGGSVLLLFEHLWHGEVVPWFPFLTAAVNPQDTVSMLHEMSTVGVTMALLVTAVWAVMVAVTNSMEKKVEKTKKLPDIS